MADQTLNQNSKLKSQNYNSKFKTDLIKRCYLMSISIINLCDTLPQKRSVWVISDQLIRSSTSIGANLVEGRSASSRLDFKKYYEIALKSSNETKYWLCLLRDCQLANPEKIDQLLKETTEISNMLAKSVLTLKSRKF